MKVIHPPTPSSKWVRIPGLSLIWPYSIFFMLISGILGFAFLLTYFLVLNPVIPLVFASILAVYYNIVFLVQMVSVIIAIARIQRVTMGDEEEEEVKKRTVLGTITLGRTLLLAVVAVIQHGFLVAAILNFNTTYYSGSGDNSWSDLLRCLFQGLDEFFSTGLNIVLPLRNFSLILFFINGAQAYVVTVIVVSIALSRTPSENKYLSHIAQNGFLASAGTHGKYVLTSRLVLDILLFSFGFLPSNPIGWILFACSVLNYAHCILVDLVYIYKASLDRVFKPSFYVFLAVIVDFCMCLMTLVATFTRIAPHQIAGLGAEFDWWTRILRSLDSAFGRLASFNAVSTIPVGNWGLLISAIIIIHSFLMRVFVLSQIYSRFIK